MVTCSINGRKKVFHQTVCGCASRIKECNKIYFDSPEAARAAGYTECSCCSRMGRHYRKEKRVVDQYCEKHSIQHFYRDNVLYFISNEDTAWKIVQGGKSPTAFFLYHESIKGHKYIRRNTPYIYRNYHSQKVRRDTILGYLEYIVDHDAYIGSKDRAEIKRANPAYGSHSAKKKAKHEKNKQRRKSIARTLYLIDNLSSSYTIPRAAVV